MAEAKTTPAKKASVFDTLVAINCNDQTEKKGGLNTIFFYGKPAETDPEGIYRSTDGGKTWVCINQSHLYGGTGNGNFLVGDMDEFGKVYMSTVGCGIVYGAVADAQAPTDVTPTETKPGTVLYGDVDESGVVDIMDVIAINKSLLGGLTLTDQGKTNADVDLNQAIDTTDALNILKAVVKLTTLPVKS